jgi:hypothetical protein
MRDKELDAKLEQARTEAAKFFAGWSFTPLREKVHRQLKSTVSFNRRRRLQIGPLVAAALLLVAVFVLRQPGYLPSTPGRLCSIPDRPIAQYTLDLKDGSEHWLSFFRIVQPNRQDQRLLAVIWGQDTKQPQGYSPLYSSVLGVGGSPGPALPVEFPGSREPWVLILSQNQDLNKPYLHYRALGFDGTQVTTYWEQDYVPAGRLEVHSGLIVEWRQARSEFKNLDRPGQPGSDKSDKEVHFLVPYQLGPDKVIAPTELLQLKTGQYISFIGNEGEIRTVVEGTALQRLAQEGNSPQFFAAHSGKSIVLLQPKDTAINRHRFIVQIKDQ